MIMIGISCLKDYTLLHLIFYENQNFHSILTCGGSSCRTLCSATLTRRKPTLITRTGALFYVAPDYLARGRRINIASDVQFTVEGMLYFFSNPFTAAYRFCNIVNAC